MGWKDHLIYPTRAPPRAGTVYKNVKKPRAWRIAAIESVGGGDKWTYVYRSHPRGIGRPITQERFNELHRLGEIYKTFKAYRYTAGTPVWEKISAPYIDAKKHEYYQWLDEKYKYAKSLKQKNYWANLGTMFLNSIPIKPKKPEQSQPPERRKYTDRRYYDRIRLYQEQVKRPGLIPRAVKRPRDTTLPKEGGDNKYQKLYDDFHTNMFEDIILSDRRDMLHEQW